MKKKILSILVIMTMIFSAVVMVINNKNAQAAWMPATTPGVDNFGNATRDFEYSTTAVEVILNTTGLTGSTTYYLYKPRYNCSSSSAAAQLFQWEDQPVETTDGPIAYISTAADPTHKTASFGNIILDRAGMWIVDTSSSHNGAQPSSFDAFIWVNTSTDYSIASIPDFRYGSNTTKTITVTEDGTGVGCYIDIIGPNGDTRLHRWSTAGTLTFETWGNITMAGNYTVRAYKDLDEHNRMYEYRDELTGSVYSGYASGSAHYYGKNFSSSLNTTLAAAGHSWDYSVCGPWDPPEKNATEMKFKVKSGIPNFSLKNHTTVYWGFDLTLEVNVTDDDGNGLTNGTLMLKKNQTTWVTNGTWSDLNIVYSNNGNYNITIGRYSAGVSNTDWEKFVNGTWYIFYTKDINGDYVQNANDWEYKQEWNGSKSFTVRTSSPPVDLKIVNDGTLPSEGTGHKIDDMLLDVNHTNPGAAGPAEFRDIVFTIYGRTVSGTRAYYGDDAHEDRHNITVVGDYLLPLNASTLYHVGSGRWTCRLYPQFIYPGGEITITVKWPGSNNGTDSETISLVNGTDVSVTPNKFTVGEHTNLTVKVKNKWNVDQQTATVYLFWQDGGAVNSTSGDGTAGNGLDGEYTFHIKPSEMVNTAPRNLTIAAVTPGTSWYGYTKAKMEKKHELNITISPETSNSGDPTEYDIDVLVDGAAPATYSDITVAVYNEDGEILTGGDAWSRVGSYDINSEEIILPAGTYQIYAYNATSDSEGHNGTITVTKYTVSSNPSVLAWLIDTETNITFSLDPAGNGTLYLKNVSDSANGTWTGYTTGAEVSIENGVGTMELFNATDLGNITYNFLPGGGESKPAIGLLQVTTANAVPEPSTIYINEPTIVTVTVTHPATGAALENIRVGLDHGIALNASKLAKLPDDEFTDGNGQVQFSVTSEASGNVTIYVKNGSDPNNKHVIMSKAKQVMSITVSNPSVDEGGTFTVYAKDANGELITDEVTVTFAGETHTLTTGSKEITAPQVPESLDYTVTGTATGYYDDDTSIKVIDVPRLFITVTGSGKDGDIYLSPITVTVYNDNGLLVTGATVTFGTESKTTINGQVEFTVEHGEEKDYTITAKFEGFEDAASVIAKVKKTPGFELLTLIAAIGIAFILLRRRKK